jgi:hypothetical protein
VHDVETSGSNAGPLLYWRGGYSSLGSSVNAQHEEG